MKLSGGQTLNMTTGDPRGMILRFAVPVFLSQLFQQLYNTVDTLTVGHMISNDAMGAVSATGSLIFLLVSFFTGASMGVGVVISRYFGAGNYEKLSRAIHTGVILGLISGVLLTAVGVAFTPAILSWMVKDATVRPIAVQYFRYYFFGVSAVVMYNLFTGIMNAVGDSRRPLYYLLLSSVLNVILDIVLILLYRAAGVTDETVLVRAPAIATVVSQAVSMVLCLMHLLKKGTVYRIRFRDLRIDREMLLEIARFGLPTGIQNSVIGLANVMVQSNISSFGNLAMAGCGAYSKIEGFVFLPITSFAMALTTFIGQNLGAGQYDRARYGARFGIATSVIMAEIIGVAVFLLAEPLMRIFVDAGDPNAAAIIEIGVRQCRTEALFFFLLAFSHCIAGICRGAGKAFVPMLIMLLVWCVFRIIYIEVAMSIRHEILLLFIAYPLTWTISSAIYLIYYKKSDWIHGFDKKKA